MDEYFRTELTPSGAVLINNGAPAASSRNVVLNISASDEILPGAAESAHAHLGGPLAEAFNQVTGGVEMRVSNDPAFPRAVWEPVVAEKPWMLGTSDSNLFRVFVQFRDGAGNESLIVTDDTVVNLLFLPAVSFTSPSTEPEEFGPFAPL